MPHSRLHARGDVLLKAYCLPSVFNKLTILVLSDSVPHAELVGWLLAALRRALVACDVCRSLSDARDALRVRSASLAACKHESHRYRTGSVGGRFGTPAREGPS